MNRQQITLFIVGTYLWLKMNLLSSIVLETFMVYPNIFHDPPESLTTALEFMAIRAPSDFYPPLGFLSWVCSAASLIAAWRVRPARCWIGLSVAMIVSEGLVSMAFFWPRNTILFIEGPAVHATDVLRRTADEFQRMHWWRVVFNAIGSGAAFTGFLRIYRQTLTTRLAWEPELTAVPVDRAAAGDCERRTDNSGERRWASEWLPRSPQRFHSGRSLRTVEVQNELTQGR